MDLFFLGSSLDFQKKKSRDFLHVSLCYWGILSLHALVQLVLPTGSMHWSHRITWRLPSDGKKFLPKSTGGSSWNKMPSNVHGSFGVVVNRDTFIKVQSQRHIRFPLGIARTRILKIRNIFTYSRHWRGCSNTTFLKSEVYLREMDLGFSIRMVFDRQSKFFRAHSVRPYSIKTSWRRTKTSSRDNIQTTNCLSGETWWRLCQLLQQGFQPFLGTLRNRRGVWVLGLEWTSTHLGIVSPLFPCTRGIP